MKKPDKKTLLASDFKIAEAKSILYDLFLYHHQLLMSEDLAAINGKGYFEIRWESRAGGTLSLFCCCKVNEAYNFPIYTKTDQEIIDLCNLIKENNYKSNVHSEACCGLAEINPCVCTISFICPIHGTKHIGTHD